MVDLGITDLRAEPEAMPPLKLLEKQYRDMSKYILESLIAAGASPEGLLTIFSSDRPVWEVPSAYMSDAPEGCASIYCVPGKASNEDAVIEVYKKVLNTVSKTGMNDKVREYLAEHFGSVAAHPYMFAPSEPGPKAVALAAAEMALMVSGRAAQANFHKGYAFVKLKASSFASRMGVVDGVVIGRREKIDVDLLEARMYGERGMFTYTTFDIYDKIRIWTDDNYFAVPDPVHFRRILAFLKMQQSPNAAYTFGQRIYTMPDYLVSDVTLKSATYTDDALDMLRNTWLTGTDSDEERYKRLYNSLVPKFIDAAQFLQMFKVDPLSAVDAKEIECINSGMETFIDHFLSVQLAARNGRVVI